MRTVSKLTVMISILAMMLSLAACGNQAKPLYGTWQMKLDITEKVAENLSEEYLDFDPEFIISVYLEFNEDGTCRFYVDEDELTEYMELWIESLTNYTVEMIYTTVEEEGIERTQAEELLTEEFGMPVYDYVHEQIKAGANIEEVVKQLEYEGAFAVEKDKLYIGSLEDEEAYDTFTIDGTVLTIDFAEGTEVFEGLDKGDYPFEFTKVIMTEAE